MLKKLSSKLAYILIGIILAIAGTAYAINVTIPQATQKGDLPTGQTSGNYQLLHPGSDGLVLTSSSTSANGLAWQTASSTGGTGISSLNGLVGASQTFATGSVTGLDVGVNSSGSTHTITPLLQAGYGIPLTASTTNWNNLYNNLFTRQVISTTSSGTVFYVTTSSPGNITINFPPNLLTTTSAASLYYLQTNPSAYISLGSLSGTAPITYNSGTGAFGCTTASSGVTGCLSGTDWNTFNNKQPAGSYLTASSTLTAGGIATFSPNITLSSSTDTNLLISIVCGTSTCTFNPAWTGTLAAGRLNSNVVQGVTNDTNVTGSISTQNLTLGWTGVLAIARGGTATSTAPTVQGQILSYDGAAAYAPTNLVAGANITITTTTKGSITITGSGSTGLSSISALTGPAIAVATSSDTNILISVSTTTANTLTFIPGFTGTLAAARLNSNVVQSFTNDTNVTASISAQNATLGWTGLLSVARGGTGANTLTANDVLFGNGTSPVGTSSSFTYNGTNLVVAGGGVFATSSSVTNASTTNLTATNLYVTGATTGCATFTGQVLSSTGVACGSGGGGGLGAGWATSTPNIVYNNFGTVVGINSTTPTANLVTQGISGSTTPIFIAATSTGANYFTVLANGNVGVGTATPLGLLDVSGALSGTPSITGKYLSLAPSTFNDTNTAGGGTAVNMVFNSLPQYTLTAANASTTYTNLYNTYFQGPPNISGNIKSVGNSTGLYVASSAVSASTTNAYGMIVNGPTGASNNYAAVFNGRTTISNVSASTTVDLGGQLNVFVQNPSAGQTLFKVGSSNANSQLVIQDGISPAFNNGLTGGSIGVGSANLNRITSTQTGANYVEMWESSFSNMTLNTLSGGAIILQPSGTTMLTASSTKGILINGAANNGTLSVKGIAAYDLADFASSSGTSVLRITSAGNVGINTSTPSNAGLTVVNGDVYVASSTKGIILKDSVSGTCYRVQMTSGALTPSALGSCP